MRLRRYRQPAERHEEVWTTIDQVIQAYEDLGIDEHTLTLGLQGAEVKLRGRVEAAMKARRKAEAEAAEAAAKKKASEDVDE